MLKVLLVDDEKLERILVRRGFDWEAHGFEIIGEVDSGKEALEFLRHRKTDLVITDINMPSMNGLDLAGFITKEFPDCKIIMLTGFREFEYARQAVKLGVEDFLLKPLNMEEIEKIAEKIKRELRERQEKQNAEERMKEQMNADLDILEESFFQRLLQKRVTKEEAVSRLNVYNCSALLTHCCCVNFSIREQEAAEGTPDRNKEVLEYIRARQYPQSICFMHYMRNIILLLMDGDPQRADRIAKEIFAGTLQGRLESTIGISDCHSGFEGIAEAYAESGKALSASVILGLDRIIPYGAYHAIMEKARPIPVFPWEDFSFELVNVLTDKAEQRVRDYFDMVRTFQGMDLSYLHLLTMDMLSKAGLTLSHYGTNLFQLMGEEQLFGHIRSLETIDESQKLVTECIRVVLDYHNTKKSKNDNRVVKKAIEYVDQNFCDPDISLTAVAEVVFSNESYLSRVIKKELGQSLIEYVTKKRIDESIRLMNTTDMKVYEIAEQVGFRDPHYFSICFKKQLGLTVKEYRKR